jgi:hypothetical protein
MSEIIKEFKVAPDADRLREVFPEMDCISHAEFNQKVLKGVYKIIQSQEIVVSDRNLRYFKVIAEVVGNDVPAGN